MSQDIEYIDALDSENPFEHSNEGTLYVQQPYLKHNISGFSSASWHLGPAKSGDVGMDIPVKIKDTDAWSDTVTLHPPTPGHINFEEGWIDIPAGSYARLPSGIHVKMPDDAWMMVRPRSSTGFKRHFSFFEGTIDSGYTGHLVCLIYNRYTLAGRVLAISRAIVTGVTRLVSDKLANWVARKTNWGSKRVKDGECLTQLILVPKYPLKKIVSVMELPSTARGASGFGSSGK